MMLVFILLGLICACSQSDQDYTKLQEKTAVEQLQQSKVEQGVLREKAMELERDLQNRYRFYSALSHVYEGQFKIGVTDFIIEVRFIPTIAIYQSERVRTVEEVINDFNNLALNAQYRIWNILSEESVNGCLFEFVRPELTAGYFNLFDGKCTDVLSISLGNSPRLLVMPEVPEKISHGLARKILNGEISTIDEITVHRQSTNSVQAQDFVLRRK